MDNLSPAQYDRFEAYRRHALPKQAVRKVWYLVWFDSKVKLLKSAFIGHPANPRSPGITACCANYRRILQSVCG